MIFNIEKLIRAFVYLSVFSITQLHWIESYAMNKSVISEESQVALKSLQARRLNQFNLQKVVADGELEKTRQIYEDYLTKDNEKLVTEHQVSAKNQRIANTDVIRITPLKEINPEKIIVYIHGGAFVFLSAKSSFGTSLPIAKELNIQVIAIDYKLAPEQKYSNMVKQIESVVRELIKNGYKPSDIVLIGDSVGGTLAISIAHALTSASIRLGGVVLLSPWVDLSFQCDSSSSAIQDEDPILRKKDYLEVAANLVIEPEYEVSSYPLNPYVLKYTSAFPPVLIQFGTVDILQNQIELFYNKLTKEGVTVEIDRYKGMWHVFQGSNPELPESRAARKVIKGFVYKYLKL